MIDIRIYFFTYTFFTFYLNNKTIFILLDLLFIYFNKDNKYALNFIKLLITINTHKYL